jgi:polyhydroxyalkanoate synthase
MKSSPLFFSPSNWEQQCLNIDRLWHAQIAQMTLGLSPSALATAYADWAIHLASSPGKQWQLVIKAWRKTHKWVTYCYNSNINTQTEPCIEPLPQDKRFSDSSWQRWPYNVTYQGFLLYQQWWHNATCGVEGVTAHHAKMVNFFTRQFLDMVAPSNFLCTNPQATDEWLHTGASSLIRGMQLRWRDTQLLWQQKPPAGTEHFQPGVNVAITPGSVVFSNEWMELIQYAPQTDKVYANPILIVPSWIMRYYILDLSPHNSLVQYLVKAGHTVLMISWRNPQAHDWQWSMDDYLRHGPLDAIEFMQNQFHGRPVQCVGYCLGGTLLSIAASWLSRQKQNCLQSLTLLAAEVDFTEPGDLSLFIDESQLDFIDDLMSTTGYLDGKQMAGAFALLNSRDMVWSRLQHHYLMGRDAVVTDLMAWNADATRMPYQQFHEYLRSLFLHNDYAEGRYKALGTPVVPMDIKIPIFALGTEWDTVVPWHSVFKIHLLTETDITFCLTTRGHNVGVVNPPYEGNPNQYWLRTTPAHEKYLQPETWQAQAQHAQGSWWPAWLEWLSQYAGTSMQASDTKHSMIQN